VKGNIRNKLSGYLVQREIRSAHRKTDVVGLENAKTIGILYDATSDKDYEMIKNYVRQLMSHSKEVVALGFINKNELPASRFMKLGLDFFTKKSLNWKLKPYNQIVTNYINKEVDILIFFNIERSIPLAYIAHQVNARFKIGKYDEIYAGLFDFMIKVDNGTGLKQMIDQVNHYLNLIKNEKYQEI